jgi:ABC-type uncharacterized transport system permease subunit
MADSAATTANSAGAQALTRFGRGYASLVGLVGLAILLQGIFAGAFIEPGSHSGALNAHDVTADVTLGLSIAAAVYAIALLRKAARSLVIGSLVLVALLVALVAIGHAITGSGDDGLTPLHVPLALLAFGQAIWLSIRAVSLRKAAR